MIVNEIQMHRLVSQFCFVKNGLPGLNSSSFVHLHLILFPQTHIVVHFREKSVSIHVTTDPWVHDDIYMPRSVTRKDLLDELVVLPTCSHEINRHVSLFLKIKVLIFYVPFATYFFLSCISPDLIQFSDLSVLATYSSKQLFVDTWPIILLNRSLWKQTRTLKCSLFFVHCQAALQPHAIGVTGDLVCMNGTYIKL